MIVLILKFLAENWKAVTVGVAIFAIVGYISVLRASVDRNEKKAKALAADIVTVQGDLKKSNAAIENMTQGMEQYKKFVDLSLSSIKATQAAISRQNIKLSKLLDNLAVAATNAKGIQDAPKIPFFMQDNISNLIGVTNGVFHYRMLQAP